MDKTTAPPPREQTPRQRMVVELYHLLRQYEQQIGAFGELLEVVAPHAAALDTGGYALAGVTDVLTKVPAAAGPVVDLLKKHSVGDRNASFDVAPFMRDLFEEYRDETWFVIIWQAFDAAFRRQPRHPIVLNSLLITSASAFETLMASSAAAFYRATPEALEAVPREKEKEFSLKDLKIIGQH